MKLPFGNAMVVGRSIYLLDRARYLVIGYASSLQSRYLLLIHDGCRVQSRGHTLANSLSLLILSCLLSRIVQELRHSCSCSQRIYNSFFSSSIIFLHTNIIKYIDEQLTNYKCSSYTRLSHPVQVLQWKRSQQNSNK